VQCWKSFKHLNKHSTTQQKTGEFRSTWHVCDEGTLWVCLCLLCGLCRLVYPSGWHALQIKERCADWCCQESHDYRTEATQDHHTKHPTPAAPKKKRQMTGERHTSNAWASQIHVSKHTVWAATSAATIAGSVFSNSSESVPSFESSLWELNSTTLATSYLEVSLTPFGSLRIICL